VFLLELDDETEEHVVADDLCISLHALINIDTNNTMKLHVIIKGTPLVALVDTGSTHIFIQEEVVSQLDLRMEQHLGLLALVHHS
jgi:hypothetical protein